MIVTIGADGVRLAEAEDVKAFHVAVADGADVDRELRGSGAGWLADDGDARIAVDWVRGAARANGVGVGWVDAFDGMLAYAAGKGWLDADRTTIQAHIEGAPHG
jgi:hypothetical protein